MVEKIIALTVLMVGMLISTIALFVIHKDNRKFERKGVIYYLLISLLLFFVFGLLGLLYENGLEWVIWMARGIAILFGIFHVWFLFANYDWADHFSFWPETLLTLALSSIAAFGFLSGLWLWDYLFEPYIDYSLLVSQSIWCLPVPYLLVRTYDFILQIPARKYVAWRFPEESPPTINLDDDNVMFIYFNLYADSARYPAGEISNQRSRMPRDVSFADFFRNFVQQYNEDNSGYPIINLRNDEEGNPIGWTFYARRTQRGRKRTINPFKNGFGQMQEGDLVQAKRVPLGEEFKPGNLVEIFIGDSDKTGSKSNDEEITFTEK